MIPTAQLIEAAFYQSGDALLLRREDRLVECNEAAMRLFGSPDRSSLLAREPWRLYAEDQPEGRKAQDTHSADLGAAAENGSSLAVRRFARNDGTTFLAQLRTSAVSGGDATYFQLAAREVAERDKMQRALEASQSNLRLILDSLPGRVAWIGADRRFRYVNRSYEAFSGHLPNQIIGRTVPEMIGQAAFDQVRIFGEAAMAGAVQHWEGWLPYADAGRRYVQRTYAPSYRDDGAIDGYFVFSLDVTEQKLGEEELQRQREALLQSEKLSALGSLLAGVAHELNNPLAIVLAQATLLKEKSQDPAVRQRSDRVYAAAERCARIVRSFLAIARQRPPKVTNIRLDEIIQAALDLTSYGLTANGIAVEVDNAVPSPEVVGDGDQLIQVLMNLITNAQHSLQDSDGRRWLRLTTEVEGDMAVLRVADNGLGVPADIASRIFEPFFTTKREGVGTGVGLSICHGIVTAHGGRLTLEDTDGGGATFVVRLPAVRTQEDASTTEATTARTSRAGSVLIVDDESDIADLIAEIMAPLFGRVDIAGDGNEALRRIERHSYDLVISDLRMPGLDGPSLHARLMGGPTPFKGRMVFVTGDTLHHRLEPFLLNTGVPIIEKPFEPKELLRSVTELMAADPGIGPSSEAPSRGPG